MVRGKKKTELDLLREELSEQIRKLDSQHNEVGTRLEERIIAIEEHVESSASRQSELSQKLEQRLVEIRTQFAKEVKISVDEVRSSLEILGLEMNNQILELSGKTEKLDAALGLKTFEIEEFRKSYANVLEELRTSKNLAVEKEEIMTKKYQELIDQVKEKEKLAIEKENLSQERIRTLQEEIRNKNQEIENLKSQLEKLDKDIKEKGKSIDQLQKKNAEIDDLKRKVKKLQEDNEMKTYELERTETKIQTMIEESRRAGAVLPNALKVFLSESESGRILNQLLTIEQVSIDELASTTGIATYTVQQIIERFQDLGIASLDKGTRRARLME